ncbi:MAG: formate dehydrogenase accessory sulfurtransferase FdhD [Vicingaceae bacterium]
MSAIKYEGIKFNSSGKEKVLDYLAKEIPLQIKVNDDIFSITLRSPGNDEELVKGLLFAEDVLSDINAIDFKHSKNEESLLDEICVITPKSNINKNFSNSRNLLSATSCGICGKTSLNEHNGNLVSNSNAKISTKKLLEMFAIMQKEQATFHKSGGSHAAASFNYEGELLSLREDVGRHNAVDKVIGDLLNKKLLNQANVLLLSGRISYELVSKCFKAKIPILAAISAPTTLAVDFAKELGICLLGFSRNDKATCYAHPEKIIF